MTAAPERPPWQRGLALTLAALLTFAFAGLGIWQLQRLGWKLDLIAQVEARLRAAPESLDALLARPPEDRAYRRVTVRGRFDHQAETLVQAVTERGGGYWVLTPLTTGDGQVLLVNRGFVAPERADPQSRAEGQITGPVSITGLARLTEPKGAFLRSNDPAGNRWYSRDVQAIAAARGLGPVAPVFLDADATPIPGGEPVGGLTVIAFRNTHLVYALTWFTLAGIAAAGTVLLHREGGRRR
ncbi:SURF1 family protein [uncultured Paracoccus sp.]|uniref:SURF1 family protein n=1 Tax=uncultured Paracoccus sp. TaxID=189685 RepID=UPI00260BCB93|nr:SURF1 family protein [uncultured Paracoccus sp.]